VFVVVDAVDRPHGLVSVAEVEDSLDLLHKIDFKFLAPEPLARRLEVIAVNLHVASSLLGVVGEIGGDFPPAGIRCLLPPDQIFRQLSEKKSLQICHTYTYCCEMEQRSAVTH
jgi:hypothetical protein